jgi:IS30 family transposase
MRRLQEQETRDKVIDLLNTTWSPEQISNRLQLDKSPVQISTSTIYRGIKNGLLPLEIKDKLRKRPYRQPKDGATGHLTVSHHISERPDEANRRLAKGHWESDTIYGSHRSGFIATHVDRKSRYLISIKLLDISTQSFMDATIHAFKGLPADKCKTFTTDHGKEFAGHKRLTEELGAEVYFADPGSPGQRGTNENTNGLLRQFFPKRTYFTNVTQADVDAACFLLNTRPRKCLGWLTPLEVFSSKTLHLT